jgi:hypothetical protein
MSATDVGICNSGLVKIGASRITSLNDGSKEALVCSEQFEKMRDLVLESHSWNFATQRISLALLPDAPAFEYAKAFGIPPGCLRVLNVQRPDINWRREGETILSNEAQLQARFIYRVTDTSKFSSLFSETLACRLAVEFAYAISNNATLADTMMKAYLRQLAEARSLNAQEGRRGPFEANDWTNARY